MQSAGDRHLLVYPGKCQVGAPSRRNSLSMAPPPSSEPQFMPASRELGSSLPYLGLSRLLKSFSPVPLSNTTFGPPLPTPAHPCPRLPTPAHHPSGSLVASCSLCSDLRNNLSPVLSLHNGWGSGEPSTTIQIPLPPCVPIPLPGHFSSHD